MFLRYNALLMLTVAAFAAQRTATAGMPSRVAPRVTPYSEILSASEVVMIGNVEKTSVVELKEKQKSAGRDGQAAPGNGLGLLLGADFLRAKLGTPSKLFACKADIRVAFIAKGQARKNDVFRVNLGYARTEQAAEQFFKAGLAKDMVAAETMLVLHLKKAPWSKEGALVLELVTPPWKLKKTDLKTKSREMITRITRYAAYLQIDALLQNFEELEEDDLAVLRRLASNKAGNMGTVKNMSIEQELLDAALKSKGTTKAAATAWMKWWAANRFVYVDKPFRILSGSAKTAKE